MVDFQSRDTRRGHDSDAEEGETEDPETAGEDDQEDTTESETVDGGADTETVEAGSEETAGVAYAIVTVAAGRTLEEDDTGGTVIEALERAGDTVATREFIGPTYDGVQTTVGALVDRRDVDAVVTLGGTGVEPTDVTVDAIGGMLDKRLPGFGELFRALVYDHDGTAAVRTRATAGVVDGVPVFCLPGAPEAARLGVEEIVREEADELVASAREPDTEE
jgi:molybdenum cofactor biosynthesis protein B